MTNSSMLVCYGGTFDPVHNGHLAVARTVRDALSARVALLPAHDPPHKGPTRADAAHRAAMLDLAVVGEHDLSVDRRELSREGPSWTVDTLAEVRAELGNDAPIAWVIGADSLFQLASWHRWHMLFELAHVLVVDRPGTLVDTDVLKARSPDVFAQIAPRWVDPGELAAAAHGRFAHVPMPVLRPESSTELRQRIRDGKPWRDWVPPPVAAYIVHHGLYQPATVILPATANIPSSDRP